MQLRIRTVKPEFFKHEKLSDLEKETGLPMRLAWIGLCALADREGRFNWRPRTIKAEILPYDEEIDFARILDALERAGMILRYEADGESFGVIPTFKKHQVVNTREAQSKLPPPPETHVHDNVMHVHACAEGKGKEGKGTEGEGKVETAPPAEVKNQILGTVFRELAGNSKRESVLNQIPLETQQEWLDTYDPKWLKDSLLHAIQNYAKDQPIDCVKDWPEKLARWFKIEKRPKFRARATADQLRAPITLPYSVTPISEILERDPELAKTRAAIGKTC